MGRGQNGCSDNPTIEKPAPTQQSHEQDSRSRDAVGQLPDANEPLVAQYGGEVGGIGRGGDEQPLRASGEHGQDDEQQRVPRLHRGGDEERRTDEGDRPERHRPPPPRDGDGSHQQAGHGQRLGCPWRQVQQAEDQISRGGTAVLLLLQVAGEVPEHVGADGEHVRKVGQQHEANSDSGEPERPGSAPSVTHGRHQCR